MKAHPTHDWIGKFRYASVGTLTSLMLTAAPSANAIVTPSDPNNWLGSSQGSLLNGEAVLYTTIAGATGRCSGSLLAGGQYILTAGHCVTGDHGNQSATNISVTFGNTGLTDTVSAYYVNPGWVSSGGNLYSGTDVALLKLTTKVTSITGFSLDLNNALGSNKILLAGYGRTGTGTSGYGDYNSGGVLHYGYNQYDAYIGTLTNPLIYAYDFDNGTTQKNYFGSTGVKDSQGNTIDSIIAAGDSGGGSFAYVNGQWELAGVHSFTWDNGGLYGEGAGDVALSADAAWLMSYLAPEPGTLALLAATLAGVGGLRTRPIPAPVARSTKTIT